MNFALLRKSIADVVQDQSKLDCFSQLPSKLSQIGAWNERLEESMEKYFLLYTAPILEFVLLKSDYLPAQWASHWSPLVTAHMILALHLRTLDDVVDGDVTGLALMKAVRQSSMLLAEAIQRIRDCGLPWTWESQSLCDKWILYEESVLKGRPLVLDDLWERASSLTVIPEMYAAIQPDDLRAYRQYLSLLMLVHDIEDLFDDVCAGRRTIPVQILRSSRSSLLFEPSVVNSVFDTLLPLVNQRLENLKSYGQARGLHYWPILLQYVSQEL